MKTNRKSDKEEICSALDIAYEKVLAEQDFHRERIEAVSNVSDHDLRVELAELGGDGIAKVMENEHWPATHQDRKKHLQQSWDEIPSRIRIDKIQDEDIRHQTYFLNEVAEHRDRIRAMAVFSEAVGSRLDHKLVYLIFHFWAECKICSQLAQEQQTIDQEKSNMLEQNAQALETLYGLIAESALDFSL